MSGASAELKPGVPVVVAPGGYISFEIETGQRLRLTQPEGEQVADFISFNRDDVRELLSMHSSRAGNLSWKLTRRAFSTATARAAGPSRRSRCGRARARGTPERAIRTRVSGSQR